MLMNIGRIVRERRQAKGMTIEQLAEKADVSVSLISRLERERVDNIKLQFSSDRKCTATADGRFFQRLAFANP